ncbi:MAG: HD domain-containing protein, partial [Xanthomonadales bacterium]
PVETVETQRPAGRHGRGDLERWIAEYRESVGEAGETCVRLVQSLYDARALDEQATDRGLELLEILEPLAPDPVTISSALVHIAALDETKRAALIAGLPEAVRNQLADLEKLKHYESGQSIDDTERSAEGLRRLLLALVKDVRVVLIDLAWQLVLLRRSVEENDEGRRLARETMLIHAPLANRLGIWQLKWELEDLSFRQLEPAQYRKIANLVAEHRTEREAFIGRFIARLEQALDEAGIRAEVRGRPKHIYSIWKKMQRKGLDFHQLFDVRAVRVLVDDLPSCYSALGLVHTLWQPIPGEFDDYITTPKGNMYQSLHTAVADREGKAVEVQIRTHEMHEHAELGVASHWRYKEGGPNDPAFDNKIAIMRQLLESSDEDLDDDAARCWTCRPARRCSISPTRCIPRSAIVVAGPRSTAASCR